MGVSTGNHTGPSIRVQIYLGLLQFQYLVYHTQPMSFLINKSLQIVISNTACFVLLHLPPILAACIIWPNDVKNPNGLLTFHKLNIYIANNVLGHV